MFPNILRARPFMHMAILGNESVTSCTSCDQSGSQLSKRSQTALIGPQSS